ncbi:MAG: HlyD family efflux transporter periplasmic adaptor subunit [Bacteroidetes bacterium]|nr:HlyD family efflux transporter periplasmic adaptor subunit [Bacteroidota bacterium]
MELIPSNLSDYTLESYLIKISTRSKIIYLLIILFVVGCISVLPFIYVDVSVQTRGFIQSDIEKQKIITPFHGRISYSHIKNGVKVEKGDTLLIIDSETIKAQKMALKNRLLENESSVYDLEKLNLIENTDNIFDHSFFRTGRYFIEYSNMLKLRNIEYQTYQRLKAEHDRNIVLHDKKLIPDSEFEKSLFSYNSEEENLNRILTYHKTVWHSDLMQRKNDLNTLHAEILHCEEELNNRILIAPVGGEIIQSMDIQEGTVVGQSQTIAEISPEGELIATCFINPGDIGLLNPDQKVRIMIDALHYNEWGLLDAEITEISDDMIVDEASHAYFRIRCKPEKTTLRLKDGTRANLRKGMSINARIVISRRSLFNLLFDKIDKWLNPYYKKES